MPGSGTTTSTQFSQKSEGKRLETRVHIIFPDNGFDILVSVTKTHRLKSIDSSLVPSHSHLSLRLRDKVWEWPGDEATWTAYHSTTHMFLSVRSVSLW